MSPNPQGTVLDDPCAVPVDPPVDPPDGWCHSLGRGVPGVLLLHATRARASTGAWETVHRWAAAATATPIQEAGGGLFAGAAAVAYALAHANHPGYAAALRILDTHITAVAADRVRAAHDRIDRSELPALAEFDLISGLTGISCYLLHRDPHGEPVRAVLHYLVRLTHPVRPNGLGAAVPGWWTPHDLTDRPSPALPGGHANLGIAHGITGPLALMATAHRRGVTVPGQIDAIDRICRWLDTWQQSSSTTAWWPGHITADEHRTGRAHQDGPARPSWCYGTPGIARALQLAALALDDHARRRTAEDALYGCVTDTRQVAQLTGPSICHGRAGLVLAATRAAADAATDALAAQLPRLRTRAVTRPITDRPHRSPGQPGLLDGATGIALTRATALQQGPQGAPWPWDACLLMPG
ncbi:lanthionine synthetase C family protein [Spirillospora sp. NPDC000708]